MSQYKGCVLWLVCILEVKQMISAMKAEELDKVLEIWVMANEQAHHFLPEGYWRNFYEEVRAEIGQAEVYVWQEKGQVCGFVGLQKDYLAGLFVHPACQGRGIGSSLMRALQQWKKALTLHVFAENSGAVRFYQRHGFVVTAQQEQEGHLEYEMAWQIS